jgi:small subunit ribosomal protein S27Ae
LKNQKTYEIVDGKLVRKQPFCPRCGKGVFMADHGDFWSCGKCGDRYNKDAFGKSVVEAHADV